MGWLASVPGWAKDLSMVIGAISAVLTFTTRWWLPALRAWRASRAAKAAMPGMLAQLSADFTAHRDFVDHELRPNNSSSIRDAVDRIERVSQATRDEVKVAVGMIRHGADTHRTEGSFEAGGDGATQWVNATFLRWTGCQLDQCLGWGWINAVAHDDRERVREEWEAAVNERRAFSSNYRLISATGALFPIECKATPIRDSRGVVVKWMGNVVCIGPLPL